MRSILRSHFNSLQNDECSILKSLNPDYSKCSSCGILYCKTILMKFLHSICDSVSPYIVMDTVIYWEDNNYCLSCLCLDCLHKWDIIEKMFPNDYTRLMNIVPVMNARNILKFHLMIQKLKPEAF